MNVDGATSMDNRHSSIGVVIRDFNGMVSATITKILLAQYNVEEVEVIALENWVLLAQEMNPSYVIFELDYLSIVHHSLQSKETNGIFGHIL